jgi:hypothetical protein
MTMSHFESHNPRGNTNLMDSIQAIQNIDAPRSGRTNRRHNRRGQEMVLSVV